MGRGEEETKGAKREEDGGRAEGLEGQGRGRGGLPGLAGAQQQGSGGLGGWERLVGGGGGRGRGRPRVEDGREGHRAGTHGESRRER